MPGGSGPFGSIPMLSGVKARSTATSYRLIEGKSAAELLKQIDKILGDAKELMQDYSKLFPTEAYQAFLVRHRRLKRSACEENSEDRIIADQRIRDSNILSIVFKSRDTRYDRIVNLLVKAEGFHTDVVSASRRCDDNDEDTIFPDMVNDSSTTDSESKSNTLYDYCTAWFPVPPSTLNPSSQSVSQQSTTSESSTCVDTRPREPFIAAASRIPLDQMGCEDPDLARDPTKFRRLIMYESAGRRILVADPNYHSIDEVYRSTTDESLQAQSRAGLEILTETDVQSSDGQQYPNFSDTPSMSSIVEAFRKASLAGTA